MKFRIGRKALADAMTIMARNLGKNEKIAVRTRSTSVVLQYEGKLVSIEIKIPAEISQKGNVRVSPEKLKKFSRSSGKHRNKDVDVEIIDGEDSFFIDSAEESVFPEVSLQSVPSSVFIEAVQRCIHAVSKEETRFCLMGALVEVRQSFHMTTTDGRRLAHSETGIGGDQFLLSTEFIREVSLTAKKEKDIHIGYYSGSDADFVIVKSGNVQYIAKQMEGLFPNWRKVVPVSPPAAWLATPPFIRIVSEAGHVADDILNMISLEWEQGKLTVSAKSDKGEFRETMEAEYASRPFRANYQWKYLLSALTACMSPNVRVEFAGGNPATVPMRISPNESDQFFTVIMPMRMDQNSR